MAGVFLAASVGLRAQSNTAPFDLNGPRIDMRVTRGGKTLPIAQVPNLQPGRQSVGAPGAAALAIGALPAGGGIPARSDESAAGELVPEGRDVAEKGCERRHSLYGPGGCPTDAALSGAGNRRRLQDAAQCGARAARVVCSRLAGPEPGQPGPFACPDLSQPVCATLRRPIPGALQATSKLLARSLTLKVKEECFELPSAEQEQCLTQNSEALVMNDGHESMVSALTSGPGHRPGDAAFLCADGGRGILQRLCGRSD